MSDNTDDSPRERYEGPMASAAKAETRDCEACGGHGYRWKSKGTDRYTYSCECTGVPDVPIDEPFTVPDSEFRKPNATGHDGCIRGLEKANATIAEQLAEIENVICGACGRPDRVLTAALADRDATIAERAAEIERLKHDVDALKFDTGTLTTERDTLRASVDYLKGERDTLRSALEIAGRRSDSQNASIAYFEQESASHDAALAEVTADRDTLRLEVQRLKDLNVEAQDRYAALEAERDELKRKLDEAEKEIAHMRESNGRADDYSAKLERVIEAANVNAGAMVNLLIAMANAGLPMPGPVPLTKEDRGGR